MCAQKHGKAKGIKKSRTTTALQQPVTQTFETAERDSLIPCAKVTVTWTMLNFSEGMNKVFEFELNLTIQVSLL